MNPPRRSPDQVVGRPHRPAALLLCLLATACATPSAGEQAADRGREIGDRLMQVRDYVGAADAYHLAARTYPDDPVVQEKYENARRMGAIQLAKAALHEAAVGHDQRAEDLLGSALAMGPDVAIVRDVERQVGSRMTGAREARRLLEQGRQLMAWDPEKATEILAGARVADPRNREIVDALLEATLRAEAHRAFARAETAWRAGDRETAVAELAGARVDGEPTTAAETLLHEVERTFVAEAADADLDAARELWRLGIHAGAGPGTTRALRSRVETLLREHCEELRGRGLPACAALVEIEARRMGATVSTPALDAARERASVDVVILPFADRTDGRHDGLRLARDLTARLIEDVRRGGPALRPQDGPTAAEDAAAFLAELRHAVVVEGAILDGAVSHGNPADTTQEITYVAEVRQEPNPEAEGALAALDELQRQIGVVNAVEERESDALRRLQAAPLRRNPSGRGNRTGDVLYQQELARVQARLDTVRRERDRLQREELVLQERVRRTPPSISRPVHRSHRLPVTTVISTATLRASLLVRRGDEPLVDEEVAAAAVHHETIAPAFPPAGLLPDLDDTPPDADLSAAAAAQMLDRLAGIVRTAAEAGALRFLRAARAAERGGRQDEAAEAYALYLLATSDAATPERAGAARALEEMLGLRVVLRTGSGDAR